jgi:hypothetical protein
MTDELARNGAVIFGKSRSWLTNLKGLTGPRESPEPDQTGYIPDKRRVSGHMVAIPMVSLSSIGTEMDSSAADNSKDEKAPESLPPQDVQVASV